MLSRLFVSVRVHALGDGASLFEGFTRALSETGYATITPRRHLRAAEHFIYWTHRHTVRCATCTQSLAPFEHHLNWWWRPR